MDQVQESYDEFNLNFRIEDTVIVNQTEMGKSFVAGLLALDNYLLCRILPTCRVGDKSRDCWYGGE